MKRPLPGILCALVLLAPWRAGSQARDFLPLSLDPGLFQNITLSSAADSLQLLQTTPQTPAPPPAAPGAKTPEPYKREEFPQWLQDLWRMEVIFVGSLPFTYFYTLESYDMYRYALSGFDYTQAPWPFRPGAEISYTASEQTWLIVTSVALSAVITAVDFLIDQISRPNER